MSTSDIGPDKENMAGRLAERSIHYLLKTGSRHVAQLNNIDITNLFHHNLFAEQMIIDIPANKV